MGSEVRPGSSQSSELADVDRDARDNGSLLAPFLPRVWIVTRVLDWLL